MQQVEKKKNVKTGKIHVKLQNFFLILMILALTAIIAAGCILVFNIGGAKPALLKYMSTWPVVGNIIGPVEEEKTPQQIELEKIEQEKNALKIKEEQLNEKEKEIEEKEKTLAAKEESLKEKEAQLDERLDRLNTKLDSVMEQVEYLEKMDAAKAMRILSNMESKDTVVQILRNMSKDKSSSILVLMDPVQAAQILEDIAAVEGSN
ncbi:MotE family protein [Lutispora thermophila]|uniref:Flagellar motility protein MotE, a chaperone for MotC folding n=1 Tax=Lutispora thermophila DSM 19022 TaxID=1122184 RepID=A0A1M6G6V0_9FIRM|nr:hypothetical protein [Lutispora thermophila]SHJ05650.1 Flagellar motility protein MotE, a chaperone for MotC folding [Lutispora thermophila DSM 19022]